MLQWVESKLSRAKLLEDKVASDAHFQHRFNTNVCFYLASSVFIVTLIRPLIADLPIFFFYAGLINSSILYALCWQLHKGKWQAHSALLIIGLCILIMVPMQIASGGANSHYSPLTAIYPMFCILLGNVGLAVMTTVFWSVLWLSFLWLGVSDLDLTVSQWNEGKTVSRTLWLILSNIMILILAIAFENRQRRLQHSLITLTVTDPLTGIGNRRAMEQALDQESQLNRRHQQTYTLMMLDVDHFKRFNDIHGHHGGDDALIKVAAKLSELAREGQDTIARYGGEEFIAILRHTHAGEAVQVAEKFRQGVMDLGLRYQESDSKVLSITIGLADSTLSNDPEKLIKLADKALYLGKQQGRNCVVSAASLAAH